MNERIREIAEQAELYAVSDNSSMLFDVWKKRYTEKFAELIIQKCVSQIALIGICNFENDDVAWTVEKSIDSIQEHFGVRRGDERTTS